MRQEFRFDFLLWFIHYTFYVSASFQTENIGRFIDQMQIIVGYFSLGQKHRLNIKYQIYCSATTKYMCYEQHCNNFNILITPICAQPIHLIELSWNKIVVRIGNVFKQEKEISNKDRERKNKMHFYFSQ